jgi:hypothetical protein
MALERQVVALIACGSGYTADDVIDVLLSERGDGLTEFRQDADGCLHYRVWADPQVRRGALA